MSERTRELLNGGLPADKVIEALKYKPFNVPSWAQLEKEYDKSKHPVMTEEEFADKATKSKMIMRSRIGCGWQKLATKRISELLFTLPVVRIYNAESDAQKSAQMVLESVLKKNRINAMNKQRARMLYAGCEFATIWYVQEADAVYGGVPSRLKLRQRTYSPMNGDAIWPLFDEFDDMIALSVEYTRKESDGVSITYFETWTDDEHVRWASRGSVTEEELHEVNGLGKIPGVYMWRSEPVWEDQSEKVYERERILSRNSNYLRKNMRPNYVIYSDDPNLKIGREAGADVKNDLTVLRYDKDARAEYVTWNQATDSLKMQLEELKKGFFMELQLPDMSMERMKELPLSGESRKMLFVDAQLKAADESGAWEEALDREMNVLKAFASAMFPGMAGEIAAMDVEQVIQPFRINDETDRVNMLMAATAGKAIMSQRTAVQNLGFVDNPDDELRRIGEETRIDTFEEGIYE